MASPSSGRKIQPASPLSSADPAVVEKGLAGMKTSLRNAQALGADTVLLVAAVVKPPVTQEEAWKRSQENIKTLIEGLHYYRSYGRG